MIVDVVQLFKSDLAERQVHQIPVCFMDIRSVRMVIVKDENRGGTATLFIDGVSLEFRTIGKATAAARQIVDMISEARETDRLDLAAVHASQAGRAMKEVIQDVSDED